MQDRYTKPFKPLAEVTLRDVQFRDIATLYAFESDPAWCTMALVKPRSAAAFDAVWTKIFQDWEAGFNHVVQKSIYTDGELCGTIGCRLIEGRWVVGYGIGRAYWGRGIASCAIGILLDVVKQRPLYASVAVSNVASIRVLLKHAFVIKAKRGMPETERFHARDELTLMLGD